MSASESGHEVFHLSEQAAQWVVSLSASKVSDEQRAAFESWLAQNPKHHEVYAQVERLWQSVTPQQRSPRHRVKALLSVVLLLGSAYLLPLSEWLADERTGIGEIRQVSLADGSTLTLDSGSAVDIAFSTHERRVILRSGRLLAEVAPDTAPNKRPFIVENRDGTAQALGTRYVVEQAEHGSAVSVIESRVAVASRAQPDQPVNLQAGQSVRFDNKRVDQPEAASPFAASWTKARLVYQDVPLDQVIADLARYRKGFLKNDDHTAQLRFTGILPADDPAAALNILENALPIRAIRGKAAIAPYAGLKILLPGLPDFAARLSWIVEDQFLRNDREPNASKNETHRNSSHRFIPPLSACSMLEPCPAWNGIRRKTSEEPSR